MLNLVNEVPYISEVGLSEERVAKILFSVDGGHNGFTVEPTS